MSLCKDFTKIAVAAAVLLALILLSGPGKANPVIDQ